MLPIEILIGKISPSSPSSPLLPSDAAVTQKENDDDDDVADDSSDAFIHGQAGRLPNVRRRRGCFHCAPQWRRRSTGSGTNERGASAVIIALIYRIYCRSSMIISMHRHGGEQGMLSGFDLPAAEKLKKLMKKLHLRS